ncbi:MAG: MaoC family dehydratase [Pseudomonadota bacterium]
MSRTFDDLAAMVGESLGTSGWTEVTQEMIDTFADCTGDRQWIHVDVERAKKESPFGGPVAHGYLSLSLLAPQMMEIDITPKGTIAATNYGLNKVRFLAPVPAGAKVRTHATLKSFEEKAPGQYLMCSEATMEIEGGDKPALVAETLAMLFAAPPRG